MAIIFDNNYNKIIKSTIDFENNSTDIEMRVYKSEETRQKEKSIRSVADEFCYNVEQLIMNNFNEIIEETNKIQPIETIKNRDEFLELHPMLKNKVEEYEKLQQEGLFILDKVLKEDINKADLKYLEKWKLLGLTDAICGKIEIVGTMSLSVNGIKDNNLSTLYSAVKEKIVSPVVDC